MVVDTIVSYDPPTDTVKIEDAKLPTARERTSAAWVGDYTLVFGGQSGAVYRDEVMRFGDKDSTIETDGPFLILQLMGIVAILLIVVWVVGKRRGKDNN